MTLAAWPHSELSSCYDIKYSEICENLIIYIYFQNADLYKIIYDAFGQLYQMFKFLDCILESKNYP